MQLISISKDRKRAMVICKQYGEQVTRHAVKIPGTSTKYTIWNRPWWRARDSKDLKMTTIDISIRNVIEELSTV